MYAKALSNQPVHFHVHTHHHTPVQARAKRPKAIKPGPLTPPAPTVRYQNASTQLDFENLVPIPWRTRAAQVWAKLSPVALWLGEAAVFLLGRVNLGFGYGITYIPFLGFNANGRGASPPPSPR